MLMLTCVSMIMCVCVCVSVCVCVIIKENAIRKFEYEQTQEDVVEESPSPELPRAALSKKLLISAIVVGTGGMLMYLVFRSLFENNT